MDCPLRTLIRAGALSAGVSAALAIAPLAHAASHGSHPGDNGTVKIHDARTGGEPRRNEPHVCTFYLDAFTLSAVGVAAALVGAGGFLVLRRRARRG